VVTLSIALVIVQRVYQHLEVLKFLVQVIIGEQYAMDEGRLTIKIPQNSSFDARFTNVNWFNLVTGAALPCSVAVQIQTFIRFDTGRYNNASIITMLPIYRLRNQISYSIKIR
jgi:hypothetical protein